QKAQVIVAAAFDRPIIDANDEIAWLHLDRSSCPAPLMGAQTNRSVQLRFAFVVTRVRAAELF
ncbi:MAG: hypothetical protein WAM51_02050, partial [Methylovirgula sp.]